MSDMRKLFVYLGSVGLIMLPVLVLAQFGEVDTYINDLGTFISTTLIPILIAVAFLVFVWGAVVYLIVADDAGEGDNRKKGKSLMLWGIIGFVLIVSIWGLVLLLAEGLDLQDTRLESIPVAPFR